jgi:anti-sigma factor RsiW
MKSGEATVVCGEAGALLEAYLDQELGPAESASVRSHVATCAACGRRLAELESFGRTIRRLPSYTAPEGLRTRIANQRTRPLFVRPLLAWAAAVTLVASLGGAGLVIRSAHNAGAIESVAESVAKDVVSSHVRALMGDHLLDVRSTDQHTVKPWFLGKLDFSPPVNDLASLGFSLAGGRLDYIGGRPVAALIYKRRDHAINLFIWPEEPATVQPADARAIRGFHVRHWTRGSMSFWAVSDLNDAELDEFAHALH